MSGPLQPCPVSKPCSASAKTWERDPTRQIARRRNFLRGEKGSETVSGYIYVQKTHENHLLAQGTHLSTKTARGL